VAAQDSLRYFHADEADTQSSKARHFWSLENTSLASPRETAAATTKPSPLPLQPKLRIGAVDDPLEREADRVANRVLHMPDATPPLAASRSASGGFVQRKCSCGGSCESCKSQAADDEHGPVRLKPAAATLAAPRSVAPPVVHDVLRSPGRPLDAATRAFFEPRLGCDLGRVRVHADARAGESADRLQADAYTVGHDLVFAPGQYAPQTQQGRRLLAHELSHVLQQSQAATPPALIQRSAKVAGCGLLNLSASILDVGGAAHVQIQGFLLSQGVQPEFEIPRATKMELGLGCRKTGTPWGAADLARRSTTGFDLAEIKPVTMGGRARAKLEVGHYRRRATQSLQRVFKFGTCGRRPAGLDDIGFQAVNGLAPFSGFSLLSGVLVGDQVIGPFSGDPSLTLKAKEVGAGAIGYWCTKNPQQQQQQPKPPGPSAGIGVSIGGSAGGAYNAGVGVSIMSDSTAYGTAGAGVSYKSDTKAAGVAGAGASAESDSLVAGAAGVGAAKDTQAAAAGAVGAGAASGSVGAATGAAAAGTSKDSATAGAGVASKGSVKDSAVAGAGAAGSGHIEGVVGAGTGSPAKPVEAKDVQGGSKTTPAPKGAEAGQQQGRPGGAPGQTAAGKGDQAGAGTGSKAGTQEGATQEGGERGTGDAGAGGGPGAGAAPKDPAEAAAAKGAQGAKDAGPDAGTATTGTPGTAGGAKDASGGGGIAAKVGGGLGVVPNVPLGASDADRRAAEAEAAKVAALLAGASDSQKALFRYLAQSAPDGRYVVPTSQWVEIMMKATEGLSEEDIKYLQSLNWKPANITADELRKKVLDALKNKPPAPSSSATGKGAAADKGAGPGATGASGGDGTAAKGTQKGGAGEKGKKEGPALSGFVTPQKYTGTLASTNQYGFQLQPDNTQIKPSTRKGAKATLEVRWNEGGVTKRAKVEYEVVADPVVDTDPNSKKQMWRFDLLSTNTEPLLLSPEGADRPTVLPARASAVYYIVKK
jgi:hypothetical protein